MRGCGISAQSFTQCHSCVIQPAPAWLLIMLILIHLFLCKSLIRSSRWGAMLRQKSADVFSLTQASVKAFCKPACSFVYAQLQFCVAPEINRFLSSAACVCVFFVTSRMWFQYNGGSADDFIKLSRTVERVNSGWAV